MVHAIRYVGKVYQNDLATRLKALGYQIRDEHDKQGNVTGWQIDGVPKEICEEFSQRRKDIDAGIEAFRAQYGRAPSRAEISVITRTTREKKFDKSNPQTAESVRAQQLARIKAADVALLKTLVERATPPKAGVEDKQRLALKAAVAHGFERVSVKRGHAILADALNAALGSVDLKRLKRALMWGEGGAQKEAVEFVCRTRNQVVAVRA
jgi:hypothetical protein